MASPSAMELLNASVPAAPGSLAREAALHHFGEVTAASALNAEIFGARGALERWGAQGLERQVLGALEGLLVLGRLALVLGGFDLHHRRRSGFLLCSAERAEARLEVIARELERGLRALEGRARHIPCVAAGRNQASIGSKQARSRVRREWW